MGKMQHGKHGLHCQDGGCQMKMHMDKRNKALAAFERAIEEEAAAPLLADMAAMKIAHSRDMKELTAKLAAENVQLARKLKRTITQRDEWRYQAQKYQARLLEKI